MSDLAEVERAQHRVLNAALDVLSTFLKEGGEAAFTHVDTGSRRLNRGGEKTLVNFLEVGDGSNSRMRVEVFFYTKEDPQIVRQDAQPRVVPEDIK